MKIFITGGAGFIGREIIKRYYGKVNDIAIYSRDENKHYFLQKEFPDVKCFIGDVRDKEDLVRCSRGYDYAIFAASLKQIETVEQNFTYAMNTIIQGAINAKRAAIENNYIAATFISSDKSRDPSTIYGAMKFLAGEHFIRKEGYTKTRLNCVIYGNVLNSTGSIIPVIDECIKNDKLFTLFHEDMTRFLVLPKEAINLIDYSLSGPKNKNIVMSDCISCLVEDMLKIYQKEKGLRYEVINSPRKDEKIHEVLITKEQGGHASKEEYNNREYIVFPEASNCGCGEMNSKDFLINKGDLHRLLTLNGFLK